MTKFTDLALDPRVLQAVMDAGYETPTPIQAQAIPPALERRDVLGIAQTGTGKTASFVLPMVTLLGQGRARARMPRSLVLAPTRELAAQVAENFDTYAKYTKLTKALLIGGVSFGEQDKLIDRGVDVLIATPGRLLDHHERGKLLLTGVEIMVVDEADRMLDMGFIPDIERIFQLTPPRRQTLFFSATMAPEIERITNTFLKSPVKIEVARQATASLTIEQQLIKFTPTRKDRSFAEKRAVLRALIKAEGESCTNAIVFCNRKMDVDVVAKSLKQHGFNASPIHGDLDQSVRTRTLDGFRDGSVHLLIASDVAARGLDIPAVSHVFNFDVPSHPEDYIHRIGRTGRAGRLGKAYTIATPHDDKYLAAVEALIKMPIPLGEVPEGAVEAASETPDRPSSSRNASGRSTEGRSTEVRSTEGRSTGGRSPRPPRGGERKVEAKVDAMPVIDTEVEASEVEAPLSETPRSETPRSESQRSEDRRPPRNSSEQRGNADRRPAENRYPPRYGNDRNGNDRVVGMGDHVPDFILRSFRIATPATEETEDEPASS